MHGEIFMFYAWQSLPCIYIVWTGWNSFDLTLSNIGDEACTAQALLTGFSIVWAFRPRESPLVRDKPRKKSFLLFTFSSYYIMAMKARNPVGITTHHRQSVTCTSTCPGASLITKLSAHFLLIAEINELVKHHENFVLSNSFHSPCPLLWTIVMRERERREMCAGTAGWVSLYKTAARHTFSLTILKQHYFSLQ